MNVLKRIFLTAVLLATASSSVVLSDTTKVSAWAYNVNNQYTAPYINYPSVITTGNPENQYVRAYGYTRNRIDKSGEHHVRAIQSFLSVSVDGNIGPITDSAIKAYQNSNNLYADGIVGQDTYRYLMYDHSVIGYMYDVGDLDITFLGDPYSVCYSK